jgi:hypothetical protein
MQMLSTRRHALATCAALAVLAGHAPAQASYTTYRTSCPSSVGTPALTAGAPIIASRWRLDVSGLRPGSMGSLFFAVRDDLLGTLLLPLDLTFLGAPGCFLNVSSDPAMGAGAASLPADAAGRATIDLGVPTSPTLIGATFYNQYVSLDAPAGRSLPLTLTNAGRGVLGHLGVADMVAIPAGTFAMGSTTGDPVEQPVHTVQISRPFWIGRFEVTQAEYQALMGTNPSRFPGPDRPVESVSWNDAMAYCAALTAQEGAAGRLPLGYEYRLPTEAEWEYCCRAGTTTPFHCGNALACTDANHNNCVAQTADVGGYAPNAFGLYDMHGNVWEACLDSWDGTANYPSAAVTDPWVTVGTSRVFRGGAWNSWPMNCRSAKRSPGAPASPADIYGFRLVLGPAMRP